MNYKGLVICDHFHCKQEHELQDLVRQHKVFSCSFCTRFFKSFISLASMLSPKLCPLEPAIMSRFCRYNRAWYKWWINSSCHHGITIKYAALEATRVKISIKISRKYTAAARYSNFWWIYWHTIYIFLAIITKFFEIF